MAASLEAAEAGPTRRLLTRPSARARRAQRARAGSRSTHPIRTIPIVMAVSGDPVEVGLLWHEPATSFKERIWVFFGMLIPLIACWSWLGSLEILYESNLNKIYFLLPDEVKRQNSTKVTP
jgi:hypothetical protein